MRIVMITLLVCAYLLGEAQTNFVKNGDFERFSTCPNQWDQLTYTSFWHPPVDSDFLFPAEYYNKCANSFSDPICHVPENPGFYQQAKSGDGFIALVLYYDKTAPRPPSEEPFDFRDYAQTKL